MIYRQKITVILFFPLRRSVGNFEFPTNHVRSKETHRWIQTSQDHFLTCYNTSQQSVTVRRFKLQSPDGGVCVIREVVLESAGEYVVLAVYRSVIVLILGAKKPLVHLCSQIRYP